MFRSWFGSWKTCTFYGKTCCLCTRLGGLPAKMASAHAIISSRICSRVPSAPAPSSARASILDNVAELFERKSEKRFRLSTIPSHSFDYPLLVRISFPKFSLTWFDKTRLTWTRSTHYRVWDGWLAPNQVRS